MRKLLNQIFEITSIPISYKNKYFYYGVSDRISALKIWESGEIPLYSGKSGYSSRTYLSNELPQACEYGEVVLGRKYGRNIIRSKGRYGYVFIIGSNELKDIFPNESEIGRYVQEIYDYQYNYKDLDQSTYSFLTWVWSILSRNEQKAIIYDEKGSYHTIGRKILDNMSNEQIIWILNKKSVRITNEGSVGFSKLLRVDRLSVSDIDPDGSDFFQKSFEVSSDKEII